MQLFEYIYRNEIKLQEYSYIHKIHEWKFLIMLINYFQNNSLDKDLSNQSILSRISKRNPCQIHLARSAGAGGCAI